MNLPKGSPSHSESKPKSLQCLPGLYMSWALVTLLPHLPLHLLPPLPHSPGSSHPDLLAGPQTPHAHSHLRAFALAGAPAQTLPLPVQPCPHASLCPDVTSSERSSLTARRRMTAPSPSAPFPPYLASLSPIALISIKTGRFT